MAIDFKKNSKLTFKYYHLVNNFKLSIASWVSSHDHQVKYYRSSASWLSDRVSRFSQKQDNQNSSQTHRSREQNGHG